MSAFLKHKGLWEEFTEQRYSEQKKKNCERIKLRYAEDPKFRKKMNDRSLEYNKTEKRKEYSREYNRRYYEQNTKRKRASERENGVENA